MALTQRLDLRQTQSLVMTPQLQQAIKLLQLSNLELSDFIDREIEQNPLLERDDPDPGGPDPGGPDPGGEGGGPDAGASAGDWPADAVGAEPVIVDSLDRATAGTLGLDADAPLDADYENVWSGAGTIDEAGVAGAPGGGEGGPGDGTLGDWGGKGAGTGFEDDRLSLEQTLAGTLTLRDHLISQLNVDIHDPGDRLIGLALIDLLDAAGYLGTDLDTVARLLQCPVERVEAVLLRMQRFDPAGVFARSLAECLAIQLRERNRLDPAMQALLDNLPLLATRNVPALLRLCGIDAEDLSDMVGEIRALDPKPGLAFEHPVAQTLTPDIIMRSQPGGGWLIELNADTLPRVLVNQRYYARISGGARDKGERDYIAERFQSANWLVKSLHQRATTILKVATDIVRQQDGFFVHGVQFLKPLILRDVADAIGMHESTVSRVTTNKFIATPRGVFELKYFFTAAIPGAAGHAAHSAEAVRFRIKALIDEEVAEAILSDDRIVEILRADGIEIARRTVAKYRESMRIPSSVQRRRDKSLRL